MSHMQNWGTFEFTAPNTRVTFSYNRIVGPPTAEEGLGIDGLRLMPEKK